MEDYKISNKGTTTLFKNPLLEALTRTYFAVPVILFVIVGVSCVFYSHWGQSISPFVSVMLFCGGIFFFTFIEYLIHRFIFHFNAETESEKQLQYKIHGVHHHYPKDKDRLVMPPVLSVTISIVFFTLFYFTMRPYSFAFFGGFCCGYSFYLYIHYAVHRYRQPKNFFSFWWKHHSLHHYKNEERAFSVSNPIWDYVFGTMPDKKSIQTNDLQKLPDYNQ